MSSDTEEGKIFVGGLAAETTSERMKEYFCQWGEVIESVLMVDKITMRSRGFGFITFKDPSSIAAVLKARPHVLDNKAVDPKPCTPKGIQQQKKQAEIKHTQTHKVFVGGISKEATEDDVRCHFERFGVVNEVVFVISKDDNRHKGFGFVTFEDEDSVNIVINKHYHEIKGRRCEAKRAEPREKLLTGRPPRRDGQNGNGNNWAGNNSSYGYGGGPQQGGGGTNWSGNMGYGNNGYGNNGYGAGGGYTTAYPQQQQQQPYGGGGYNNYGYGYGSQAMGYGGMGGNKPDGGKGDSFNNTSGYGGGQQSNYGGNRNGGANSYGQQPAGGYGGDASRRGGQTSYHPYSR